MMILGESPGTFIPRDYEFEGNEVPLLQSCITPNTTHP